MKNATFTGSAVKSDVDVRLGNVTLKEGTHYTLSYKNNVNAGTAQVTVSGKGSLEGAVTKDFTIAKADISKASISASGTYAPDGVKIGINAKLGNYTLKSSDYSFTAPTAAGEQTLTISETTTSAAKYGEMQCGKSGYSKCQIVFIAVNRRQGLYRNGNL